MIQGSTSHGPVTLPGLSKTRNAVFHFTPDRFSSAIRSLGWKEHRDHNIAFGTRRRSQGRQLSIDLGKRTRQITIENVAATYKPARSCSIQTEAIRLTSTTSHSHSPTRKLYTMSDMKATLAKANDGSLIVNGFEELKYNFHYTSPVFDINHTKLAEIYEKWGRVLIVIDTSE